MERTRRQSDDRRARPTSAVAVTTHGQVARPRSVSGTIEGRQGTDDQEVVEAPARPASAAEIGLRTQPTIRFPRGLRRLRDRLQALEARLRLDVNGLKQEIVDLNVQRQALETKRTVERKLLLQKSVEVVVEYFGAFQHGWIVAAAADQQIAELEATSGPSLVMVRTPRQAEEQAAFLRERQRLLIDRQQQFSKTAMAPTMCFGELCNGVDEFINQWKKYSECHRAPRLTLTCMSCHGSADEPIVVAIGTFSGTLTLKALEDRYPSALAQPRIVKRLVGAAIRYPSREIFYFDNSGSITRYDRGLDYIDAFSHLLESLDDVASVLTDATVVDDGRGQRIRAVLDECLVATRVEQTSAYDAATEGGNRITQTEQHLQNVVVDLEEKIVVL